MQEAVIEKLRPMKVRFDHLYNQEDPREYFETLQKLEYSTPQFAKPVFRRCIETLKEIREREAITIVDVCCGYGVNSALVNHRVDLDDLYDRYTQEPVAAGPAATVTKQDRDYYNEHKRMETGSRIYGIDVADNALSYAAEVNLLEEGFAQNLEEDAPDDALSAVLEQADLITVTGGMSYIGETTFTRLLEGSNPEARPWVVCYPLRVTDFDPVCEVFREFDLTAETWDEETFPHRRFVNAEEMRKVLGQLEDSGIDPAGKEATGYYHAELHVARPPAEAAAVPLRELVANP